MDRRALLAIAASAALSADQTLACSVVLRNPRDSGLASTQVRHLFDAWWSRDREKFQGYFTQRLMADGTPMDQELANEIAARDPLPPDAFGIFDQFFTDTNKVRRITLIVNTDAAILVACSETEQSPHIQADCSGLPKLHLFAVTMSGLNPRSIKHIATTETVEVDKFDIWFAGSS